MAGYYRNFCLNFSEIATSLTNLLCKKVKFVWTDDCQLAFDKVKLLLQKSPVLKSPDYEKPFKLIIDSSDVTQSGLYQYKVMPFRMKHAPATFQRMVNKLVRDIDGCEGYIDDVVIYSDNWSVSRYLAYLLFRIFVGVLLLNLSAGDNTCLR